MAATNGSGGQKPPPFHSPKSAWDHLEDVEPPGTPKTPRTSTTPGERKNLTYFVVFRLMTNVNLKYCSILNHFNGNLVYL